MLHRYNTKKLGGRAVVLLHVVDKDDLVWITPIVQRAKVEAYVTAEGLTPCPQKKLDCHYFHSSRLLRWN
jgi:hypothetical protein